jgi:hypothetical protein
MFLGLTVYLFSIDNFIWPLRKMFVLEFIPLSCIYGQCQSTVSVYTASNDSMVEIVRVLSTHVWLASIMINESLIKKGFEWKW